MSDDNMPIVSFSGWEFSKTLSSGRVVKLCRSDDLQHWGLRFGHATDDSDAFEFALSNEAFAALVSGIEAHARPEKTHQGWIVHFVSKPSETQE